MPRARLITRSMEASREVLELLRARGFEVEVVSPEDQSVEPADLEVKIEECSAEEALDRAEAMPHASDLCAFVAPGTLSGERVLAIPLLPDAAEDIGPVLGAPHFATSADAPHHSTFNAALAHVTAETGFEFGASFAPESDEEVPQERTADVPTPVPMPASIAMPATSVAAPSAESAYSSSAQNRAAGMAPVLAAPAPPRPRLSQRADSWGMSAHRALASLRGTTKSWLDLALARSAFAAFPSQRYRARTISDASFWKAATVIAALAVSALLVGASARRAPLLANLARSSRTSQKPPFTQAPEADASPAHSTSVPIRGERRAERRRSARASAIIDEILSATAPSDSNSSADRTSARSRHRGSTNERSLVADDVIVYFEKKPVPPPAPPALRSGIKHYSDLR